jgi:site-specific DNA-methyltransferase (adenine-specific)
MLAAARTGRRYVGFDLDPAYVEIARKRLAAEPAASEVLDVDTRSASKLAEYLLERAGFAEIRNNQRAKGTGVTPNLTAVDATGNPWLFEIGGSNTRHRGGLLRTEVVWKALGRAAALKRHRLSDPAREIPLVLLTSHLPKHASGNDKALRSAGPTAFFDIVSMLSSDALDRLTRYCDGSAATPLPGFWTERELDAS